MSDQLLTDADPIPPTIPATPPMYCIWNAKLGGWLTAAGTYSSEYADAKRLPRPDAIAACAIHVLRSDSHVTYGWLPCYVADLEQTKDHANG